MTRGVLKCVICNGSYGKGDVEEGKFSPDTLVCLSCYESMANAPRAMSCFGKGTIIIQATGERKLGYDPRAQECKDLCPDRKICVRFVLGYRIASEVG